MNIELKLKCGSDGPFGAPTSCVEVEIASPLANQIEQLPSMKEVVIAEYLCEK